MLRHKFVVPLKSLVLHSEEAVGKLYFLSFTDFGFHHEKTKTKPHPIPPYGLDALHSSASGKRVWAWHLLYIPTPEFHRWSSGHPEASQSVEVQL